MPKPVTASDPVLHFTGIALVTLCTMTLSFALLSWWLGGDDYMDSIYGRHAIPILLLGIAAGVAIKRFYSRRVKVG